MGEFVSHGELDAAIADVRKDIQETEQRLREEWTNTVRWEVGRVDTHLEDQDTKINATLYLIVTLVVTVLGALLYAVLK